MLILQFIRKRRALTPEIYEIVADQNPVDARITSNVIRVQRAIRAGVERIALLPSSPSRNSEINVVPATLLPTAIAVRLLGFKTRVSAVLVRADSILTTSANRILTRG